MWHCLWAIESTWILAVKSRQCWCLCKDGGLKSETKFGSDSYICAHFFCLRRELGEAKVALPYLCMRIFTCALSCSVEKWKEVWIVWVLTTFVSLHACGHNLNKNPASAAATGGLCKVRRHWAEEVYGKTIPHVESTIGVSPFFGTAFHVKSFLISVTSHSQSQGTYSNIFCAVNKSTQGLIN